MGVASGCGEQEAGVASGSGWNLWVRLVGVVLRRYIDFLILLIPTPLVSVLFAAVRNHDFFTSRGAYIKLRYIAHSIGNQQYTSRSAKAIHVHVFLQLVFVSS